MTLDLGVNWTGSTGGSPIHPNSGGPLGLLQACRLVSALLQFTFLTIPPAAAPVLGQSTVRTPNLGLGESLQHCDPGRGVGRCP